MVLKKVKIYLMHGLLGLETHFWCRIGSKCKCGYFCKKFSSSSSFQRFKSLKFFFSWSNSSRNLVASKKGLFL